MLKHPVFSHSNSFPWQIFPFEPADEFRESYGPMGNSCGYVKGKGVVQKSWPLKKWVVSGGWESKTCYRSPKHMTCSTFGHSNLLKVKTIQNDTLISLLNMWFNPQKHCNIHTFIWFPNYLRNLVLRPKDLSWFYYVRAALNATLLRFSLVQNKGCVLMQLT